MSDLRPRRPTAADVARSSAVSPATVSYVLNATPGQSISEATRSRVLAAAAELGYVPSASAQALARGRSKVVVIDFGGLPFGNTTARAARDLAEAFDARGFIPMVDELSHRRDHHAVLVNLAQALVPSVVVTATPLPGQIRSQLEAAGVEVVFSLLGSPADVAELMASGTREQFRHLHGRGHRSVAYAPEQQGSLDDMVELRHKVALDEGARLGIDVQVLSGFPDLARLGESLASLGRSDRMPTAIAAYNDEVALAALSAAHRLGLRIPEDIAVIGVNDQPIASLAWPALTTVRFGPSEPMPLDRLVDALLSPRTASLRMPQVTAATVVRESA